MRQIEIEFCELWVELRGSDGCALWRPGDEWGELADWGHPRVTEMLRGEVSKEQLCGLTPRGADLVASYEHALAQELPIVADDEGEVIDASFEVEQIDCPDCDEGFIGIQIGSLPGSKEIIHRVWPATCPRCKGSQKIAHEPARLTSESSVDDFAEAIERHRERRSGDRRLGDLSAREREALVGKSVEALNFAGRVIWSGVALASAEGLVVGGTLINDPDWDIREVAPGWVTNPDRMRAVLQDALLHGLTVEMKSIDGTGRSIARQSKVHGETLKVTGRVCVDSCCDTYLTWANVGVPTVSDRGVVATITAVRVLT